MNAKIIAMVIETVFCTAVAHGIGKITLPAAMKAMGVTETVKVADVPDEEVQPLEEDATK